jgi:hypothetical protein
VCLLLPLDIGQLIAVPAADKTKYPQGIAFVSNEILEAQKKEASPSKKSSDAAGSHPEGLAQPTENEEEVEREWLQRLEKTGLVPAGLIEEKSSRIPMVRAGPGNTAGEVLWWSGGSRAVS